MFYSKNLKKFKKIKHCFFSRKGGFSSGLYKGLNCGRGSNDKKKNINKNLSFVKKKIKVTKNNLILMYQMHTNKVVEIKKDNFKKKMVCDAIITKLNGFALGVVTADCVPILLYDKRNQVIACIHAGWKGAFKGVIENTIKKIKKKNSNNKFYASIGPCIGQKNYEVDIKFLRKFLIKSRKNKKYFIKKNDSKWLFNLRNFVTDKLSKFNVKIDQINRDTFSERQNFFSYRRSTILKQRDYGRCISVISLL